MADIDSYRDVLGAAVRAVWPKLADAVADIDGALFGGTALATHIRHRESFDLDYMAYTYFSGEALAARLAEDAVVVVDVAGPSQLRATVDGVAVDVSTTPHPSDDPSRVTQIDEPTTIDGLAVASLPDLLASKLDVIMYRPKLRDYVDIAAIDRSGRLRIEDGLRMHTERYGTTPRSGALDEIVDLLEDPGMLTTDRVIAQDATSALSHLASRAPALRDYLASADAPLEGTVAAPTRPAARHTPQPPTGPGPHAAPPQPPLRPRIAAALRSQPRASYTAIAKHLGTTAAYVGRVARDEGLTRRAPRRRR